MYQLTPLMSQSWRDQGCRSHSFTSPLLGRIKLFFKEERKVENTSGSSLFVPKAGDQFCQCTDNALSRHWTKWLVVSIDKPGLFSSLVLHETTHIKVFWCWKHTRCITAELIYQKCLWYNPSTKDGGFFAVFCNTSNFSSFPTYFQLFGTAFIIASLC